MYNLSNVTDLTNSLKNPECSISWNNAILEYCSDWKQYLNNYDFYIICIWVFLIAGIISRFWNYEKHTTYYIDEREVKIDIDLMRSIQNIAIGALVIRIFQLYYLSKIYLGW